MNQLASTFSESWYRVSGLRVSLHPTVKVRKQVFRGETWYVLRDPFNNQYFRLRPEAHDFIARLRPDRTVGEVWEECLDRHPDHAPGQEDVIRLLTQLYFANLLHSQKPADSNKLFERYQRRRQREIQSKLLSIMFIRIPLLDPDNFLKKFLPLFRYLISPFGAMVWLLTVAAAIKLVVDRFEQATNQFQGILSPDNLFLMYIGLVLIKTLHEFGHAVICRRFGGEVHTMGLMLLVFTPLPYMDATSSWSFRSRWQRALVGGAGMITEIFVAALATFLWANTGPGAMHSLAYNMMLIASVSTVLFNINPLLRFDGYYILSDLLDIPNLHTRSRKHLRHLVERYVFGYQSSTSPTERFKEAFWLSVFGVLSGIYRVVVFTGIILFVADKFLLVGLLMAGICLISWGVVPLFRLAAYLSSSPRLARTRGRAVLITICFFALILSLFAVIPFPNRFRAPGVLASDQYTKVINEVPGYVKGVLVRSGEQVRTGTPLIALSDQEVETEIDITLAQREETRAMRLRALRRQAADIEPIERRMASVEAKLANLHMRRSALVVRARQGGIWVSPNLQDMVGAWVQRGSVLGEIVNPDAFHFTTVVSQEKAAELFTGKIGKLEARIYGQGGKKPDDPDIQDHSLSAGEIAFRRSGMARRGRCRRFGPGRHRSDGRRTVFSDRRPCRTAARGGVASRTVRKAALYPAAETTSFPVVAQAETAPPEEVSALILPTQDYRRTRISIPEKLHQGLDGRVHGLLGWYRRRAGIGRSIQREAEIISETAGKFHQLSDRRLRRRLGEMRDCFRRQSPTVEDCLPEALSILVEVAYRTLGLRPYPVQVMGAMALHQGYLAEMATGEGKSLTACLPSVLAAWTGRPFHFITVNDYLAQRDATEMRSFYAFCGVSVGCVTGEMVPKERRLNYSSGVVYTTLKELVADLLRDRLILGSLQDPSRRLVRQILQPRLRNLDNVVLKGLDTAVVDEADSLLIDEAVTPLIISRAHENRPLVEACRTASEIAETLRLGSDYTVDLRYKEITLTKEGIDRVEKLSRQLPGIWQGPARREELIRQALTARVFYRRDRQYVIQDGKVAIVDEFTGRLMPNRTWRQGLHQAVEAKEGLEVNDPSETLARLSFQRFFRFFRKLSGMTGTAKEATAEFWHIYRLPVMTIPTNRPCIRRMFPDRVYTTAGEKWEAVVADIEQWHRTGRPVLVGTRSVQASETLSALLKNRGLDHDLLNAVRHTEEARIVAAAGERYRITISTNMAGRGTDIKLGRGVVDLDGLHVIATERHESGRIDRQLFGRCARQGDPGSAQAFMSTEDELIHRFVPAPMRRRLAGALDRRSTGSYALAKLALRHAQKAAQHLAYRQRRNVLKMDTWLEEALSFAGTDAGF